LRKRRSNLSQAFTGDPASFPLGEGQGGRATAPVERPLAVFVDLRTEEKMGGNWLAGEFALFGLHFQNWMPVCASIVLIACLYGWARS
jgi:hypothetical protein